MAVPRCLTPFVLALAAALMFAAPTGARFDAPLLGAERIPGAAAPAESRHAARDSSRDRHPQLIRESCGRLSRGRAAILNHRAAGRGVPRTGTRRLDRHGPSGVSEGLSCRLFGLGSLFCER